MASIFTGGNVPNRANGIWVIEQKILGAIGSIGGSSTVTGGGGTVSGIGSPEGIVTAPEGTIYTDRTDPVNPVMYSKTSGVGNTGWQSFIGN